MNVKIEGNPASRRSAQTNRDWALSQGFVIDDKTAKFIASEWAGKTGPGAVLDRLRRGEEVEEQVLARAIMHTMVREGPEPADMYALMGWFTHHLAYPDVAVEVDMTEAEPEAPIDAPPEPPKRRQVIDLRDDLEDEGTDDKPRRRLSHKR